MESIWISIDKNINTRLNKKTKGNIDKNINYILCRNIIDNVETIVNNSTWVNIVSIINQNIKKVIKHEKH